METVALITPIVFWIAVTVGLVWFVVRLLKKNSQSR